MTAMISAIRELEGVASHAGAEDRALHQFAASHGLSLPSHHKEILTWSNGIEAYAGYFRLFGVNSKESVDSVLRNQYDNWKFAWQDRCAAYWCFGETAWGDQYAYSNDSLHEQGESPVYFLDAMSMTPQVICASFSEFFERDFIRAARDPYDEMIRLAKRKFGPLDVAQHLIYMPSLLLGGKELIDNVQTMNARTAMICSGDLAIQLDDGPSDGSVKSVNTYQDAQGRMRLQLEWA
jgi:hypothetical protein